MTPKRTIYRQIDSKLITPEMYNNASLVKYTSHLNAWRDSILSALSDLGVSMTEYQVSDKNSFIQSSDVIDHLGSVFPTNTYGYGYQYSVSPTPSDDSVVYSEYPEQTKYVAFHFQLNGIDFVAMLFVRQETKMYLQLFVKGLPVKSYPLANDYSVNKSAGIAGLLLKALLEAYFNTGELPHVTSEKETQAFVATWQQSQKGGSKKKVKSSLRPSAPALTQHDIASLLSSSNPTHVFWSPLLNKAAVKDSHGWYVASFRYLNSGWTLDWFTLSATPIKSKNGRFIRYGGSLLIPID